MRVIFLAFLLAVICLALPTDAVEAQQNPVSPFGVQKPSPYGGPVTYSQSEGEGVPGKGLRVGPFSLKPGIEVDGTYTDNADLTNQNRKSDFIFSLSPTLSFTLGEGSKLFRDHVSFGYIGDLGAYMRTGGNDNTSHTLWADINLMKRPTTYMRLREAITYTNNPYGSDNFVGQGVTNARLLNEADFVVGRNLPRDYSVELGYQNSWENYLDQEYQHWTNMTNTLKPTLLYELTGKTKLLAQYSFAYTNYYEQPSSFAPNYLVQEAMAGVRWAATARLSGEVKAGYSWRSFVNEFDEFGIPYKDNNLPVYAATVHYLISPKTNVDLNVYRQFEVGTDIASIALAQDSYTRNAAGLTLATRPRKNLTFTLAGSVYLDQYDDTFLFQNRVDHYYNAGLGFKHQLRHWLHWGLGYSFEKRNSDIPENNYTANSVTASIGLTY